MAITLYVGGKKTYAKKAKSADKFVIDPVFEAAVHGSEQQLNQLLRDFLNDRESEKDQKRKKQAEAGRERAAG